MAKYTSLKDFLKVEHQCEYKKIMQGAKKHSLAYKRKVTFDEYVGMLCAENPKIRALVQVRDPNFITDEDLAKLEQLLTQPNLTDIGKKVQGLGKVSQFMNEQDSTKVRRRVAQELYDSMEEEQRQGYNPDALSEVLRVYIPKMNVGVFSIPTSGNGNENNDNPEEFIRQNESIFKDHSEIARRLLKRYHLEQLQKIKSPDEAKKYLEDKL